MVEKGKNNWKLPLLITAGLIIGATALSLTGLIGRVIYTEAVVKPAVNKFIETTNQIANDAKANRYIIKSETVKPKPIKDCIKTTGGIINEQTIECRNGYELTYKYFPTTGKTEEISRTPLTDYHEIEQVSND